MDGLLEVQHVMIVLPAQGCDKVVRKKIQKEEVQTVKIKVRRSTDLLRGQKIIARNEVDGFYYPGKYG